MKAGSSWVEEAKRRAALKAVGHVRDGFVVGLGSGSTVEYAVRAMGRRVREEGIRVFCIPTSYQIQMLAAECGIPSATLFDYPRPDLSIDGADQIDRRLNMIKGGGGALALEKVVDASARSVVIIVDETKLTDRLGEGRPVPIEVLPPATPLVLRRISEMGGKGRVREGTGKVGPVITDNGNVIIDADFGIIGSPGELDAALNGIPGVVENGLFVRLATMAYVGTRELDVVVLESQKSQEAT